jgi:hypothetical protein
MGMDALFYSHIFSLYILLSSRFVVLVQQLSPIDTISHRSLSHFINRLGFLSEEGQGSAYSS